MTTPVVFRMWLEKPSSCIALLPKVKPKQPWNVASYEPGCGVSDASPYVYSEMTRDATKRERAELEQELRALYGDLEILHCLPRRNE
jgi:hypothetical protein